MPRSLNLQHFGPLAAIGAADVHEEMQGVVAMEGELVGLGIEKGPVCHYEIAYVLVVEVGEVCCADVRVHAVQILCLDHIERTYARRSVKRHVVLLEQHQVNIAHCIVHKGFVICRHNVAGGAVSTAMPLERLLYLQAFQDAVADCMVLDSGFLESINNTFAALGKGDALLGNQHQAVAGLHVL